MKKILLTNDDGVNAEGIIAVAKQLINKYEVYIVSPDSQRSGASQSITLRNTIRMKRVYIDGLEKASIYAISGTPADCVKFATGTLCIKPDFVISGMNLGANIGIDVQYSGTIGAAIESAMLGYPTVALSVISHDAHYVDDAVKACMSAIEFCDKNPDQCRLLSVNVPDMPYEQIKGVKLARLSTASHSPSYTLQEDGSYLMPFWSLDENEEEGTDEYYVSRGYVTWTPLLFNICDNNSFEKIQKIIGVKNLMEII